MWLFVWEVSMFGFVDWGIILPRVVIIDKRMHTGFNGVRSKLWVEWYAIQDLNP